MLYLIFRTRTSVIYLLDDSHLVTHTLNMKYIDSDSFKWQLATVVPMIEFDHRIAPRFR